MPKYKLPRSEKDQIMEMPVPVNAMGPDDWQRKVTIPVDDEILECCDVDDDITIILTGRVSRKTDRTSSDGYDERSLEIDLLTVAVPDEEKSDEDAMLDAFNKGFSKKRPY